jgi:hypothetical protein
MTRDPTLNGTDAPAATKNRKNFIRSIEVLLPALKNAHYLQSSEGKSMSGGSPAGYIRNAFYHGLGLLSVFCFSLPILSRLYVLTIPVALNPDEAQWTVSARRILDDPVVWRANDLTTSGPLNALVISWPYIFGVVPSIFTSRLTGLLLQSAILVALVSLIRPSERLGPGTMAVLATTILLALAINSDYLHYSSELLSLALMAAFCFSFVGLDETRRSVWRWGLCGLIASCLPFAKLQSSMFCLLFHCACVGRLLFDLNRGRISLGEIITYISGAILPPLVLIAPLFLVGEQQAVITGYLGLGTGYGGERGFLVFRPVAPLFLFMGMLFAIAIIRAPSFAKVRWDLLFISVCLWPVIVLSIWLPGRPFAHYTTYAIVGLPLAVILAQRSLPPVRSRPLVIALLLVPVVVVAAVRLPDWLTTRATAGLESLFASDNEGKNSRPLFAWTGVTSADALLMWGWEPQLTAYAGLRPADRAAHAEYLIRPNNGREYFRNRVLRDLALSKPALIMDTIRPGYFFTNFPGYSPDTSNLQSFPELYNIVKGGYEQIGGGAKCAALYLRQDLTVAWRSAEIPLSSSTGALVDGSISEKCNDWWAPDISLKEIALLRLSKPEPIHELWILSSRGGQYRERGTARIRVKFASQMGEKTEEIVHLFDYPLWTVISGPKSQAISQIEIETLDYVGAGPALNEVKAFRR